MRDGPSHYSFRKWEDCPRCGFTYPKNELKRDYTGRKVCPECWDQKGFNEYKASINMSIEEFTESDSMEDII